MCLFFYSCVFFSSYSDVKFRRKAQGLLFPNAKSRFCTFSNHPRKFQEPFLAFWGKCFFSLAAVSKLLMIPTLTRIVRRVFVASSFQNTDNKRKNNKKNHHHQIIMQGARQSDVFFGERESGQDVRQSNVTAVQAVANIVKSSLGPVGLDKVSYCFRGKKSTLASDRFFLSAARFVTRRLARFILLQNAEEY